MSPACRCGHRREAHSDLLMSGPTEASLTACWCGCEAFVESADPPLSPTPDRAAKAERIFAIARAAVTPAEQHRALDRIEEELR